MRSIHRAVLFKNTNFKVFNMAEKKISIDSKLVQALHQDMKDTIQKKVLEKGWNETEKEEFISAFLKLYEETVEVAVRENTIVNHEEETTSSDTVKEELETLDKAWAKEVNEMCAESEDLLTCTVKKRKCYPQKTKEHLRKKHATELINLEMVEDRVTNKENSDQGTDCQTGFDMTECESSWPTLNLACASLTEFSKSLIETKEKFERLNTVTKMKLKMKDNSKIFATPRRESLDDTISESNTLSTRWCHNERLTGCVRKTLPDRT